MRNTSSIRPNTVFLNVPLFTWCMQNVKCKDDYDTYLSMYHTANVNLTSITLNHQKLGCILPISSTSHKKWVKSGCEHHLYHKYVYMMWCFHEIAPRLPPGNLSPLCAPFFSLSHRFNEKRWKVFYTLSSVLNCRLIRKMEIIRLWVGCCVCVFLVCYT